VELKIKVFLAATERAELVYADTWDAGGWAGQGVPGGWAVLLSGINHRAFGGKGKEWDGPG